jgi:hypothetical protein
MKLFSLRLAALVLVAALAAVPAMASGLYNYYAGYGTATAVGYNGWSSSATGHSWGWGAGAYARAYTNTYPYARSAVSVGWTGASATAFSSFAGRTAYASGTGYTAGYPWWGGGGYFNAVATTTGSPSYASAFARPLSYWTYYYTVPAAVWSSWVGLYGWYIPYRLNFWYWGWIDAPDSGDMGFSANLYARDPIAATTTPLLNDGFRHTGGAGYKQRGNQLSPSDLVYNPDVGGTGREGFDIVGHNGTIGASPYSFAFLNSAELLGFDGANFYLQSNFTIDGDIGQVPEPGTWGLCALALVLISVGRLHWGRGGGAQQTR